MFFRLLRFVLTCYFPALVYLWRYVYPPAAPDCIYPWWCLLSQVTVARDRRSPRAYSVLPQSSDSLYTKVMWPEFQLYSATFHPRMFQRTSPARLLPEYSYTHAPMIIFTYFSYWYLVMLFYIYYIMMYILYIVLCDEACYNTRCWQHTLARKLLIWRNSFNIP